MKPKDKANQHGDHYEENGEDFMNDNINGTDWHIPEKYDRERQIEKGDDEIERWINQR